MKSFIIILFLFAASCINTGNEKTLSGIYVASYGHEFGYTDDTLIVSKANDGDDIYKINRRSGVNKKFEGKLFPKEVLNDTWILEYNPDKKTLKDLKLGKTLVWDSNMQTLLLGKRRYKRLSN